MALFLLDMEGFIINVISPGRDLNPRSRPYQGRAMPAKPPGQPSILYARSDYNVFGYMKLTKAFGHNQR